MNKRKLIGGLKFEIFSEIKFETTTEALIEGLLDFGSFALLVGESNAGKTFVALDLALSVAQGLSWFGKKVTQGAVLYVAAEGGGGIKKRIVAYKNEKKLKDIPVPFRLAQGAVDLLDSSTHIPELIASIHETKKIFEMPVHLVVIDTLNRSLAGGDENASADMGTFVKNIDFIRQETSAAVLVVHHTGKDTRKGARGHSLLKGAVDTELLVENSGKSHPCIKTTKQRDYELMEATHFQLKRVDLHTTPTGQVVASCVLQVIGMNPSSDLNKPNLTKVSLNALKSLQNLVGPNHQKGINEGVWRDAFLLEHYKSSSRQTRSGAFLKAKKDLLGFYIEVRDEDVFLSTK